MNHGERVGEIVDLVLGLEVGFLVGVRVVGYADGLRVGEADGSDNDGFCVGGNLTGMALGLTVGLAVGIKVIGLADGTKVGEMVGLALGRNVGVYEG